MVTEVPNVVDMAQVLKSGLKDLLKVSTSLPLLPDTEVSDMIPDSGRGEVKLVRCD